jgi:hypothetical protein
MTKTKILVAAAFAAALGLAGLGAAQGLGTAAQVSGGGGKSGAPVALPSDYIWTMGPPPASATVVPCPPGSDPDTDTIKHGCYIDQFGVRRRWLGVVIGNDAEAHGK